jgi:O-antigen chain-terminating methyltransferase
MAGGSRDSPSDVEGPRRSLARALYRLSPWGLRNRLDQHAAFVEELAGSLERRLDLVEQRLDSVEQQLGSAERRFDPLENGVRALQEQLERVDRDRLVPLEGRLDRVEAEQRELMATTYRLRDEVVPAVVDRGNLLIDRLASELDEVASLVERSLRSEPLPMPAFTADEDELSAALAEIQPRLVASLRGSEDEIRHRLDRYLPALRAAAPVLDLGCGRGELLVMLREAGVEALGLEQDPALAQAARRRGLEVVEGDALEQLRRQPDDRWGAVTAIHLMEHLEPAAALAVLAEIRRVLRPGGLLLVECPNPRTLRVGAAEFWLDPTHRRPLLPETVQLFATASGLRVDRVEFLHPFPDEQRLGTSAAGEAGGGGDEPLRRRLDELTRRLDEVLNGPRDFVVTASKPTGAGE